MATEYQAAMARLAADTKTACATSADIVKAAKAKAAASAAHVAAKPAAKGTAYHAKAISYHAKAAVAAHSFYFTIAGGIIIGIVAYHLVNKYWLNKDDTA